MAHPFAAAPPAQDPQRFLESAFDRKFYAATATENLAVGLFDKRARPWPYEAVQAHHTHFSCALFEWNTPASVNDFRRTKDRWTGAIGIALDDIGEVKNGVLIKAPPVEPTAIIETKPGSFQYVYLFNEIERDRTLIDAIQRSAIAAGMCDAGAGNITRITRLPNSLPEGKTHRAKLVWADWTRRFNSKVFIEKALQVARVEAPAPQEYAAPNLSYETSEAGQGTLEAACHKIRNVGGVTGSGTINTQAFFVGQNVGAGLIALADAEAALFAAAYARHPADGIRQAKNGLKAGTLKPLARQANGRFTGQGAVRLDDAEQDGPDFKEVDAARKEIRTKLDAFIQQALDYTDFHDPDEPAPTIPIMALAATPGAGKTGAALASLGAADISTLSGDVVFYSPTLALSEQAAADFEEITGKTAHVTRGRSAKIPGTDTPMCARSELAEKVGQLGLNVRATLCESKDSLGLLHRCPHFHGCAHVEQWAELPKTPVVRFESTAYFEIGFDGSGRETGMRVVDETIWQRSTRIIDISPENWTAARNCDDPFLAADAQQAAIGVLSALQAGESPLIEGYTSATFLEYRDAEITPINMGRCAPDSPDQDFHDRLATDAGLNKGGKANAALWAVLADCADGVILHPERIRLIETKDGATRIRLTYFSPPPSARPTLLLDADITAPILERLYPGADLVRVDLKPNAHVVQLTDRTFSNAKLQKAEVRRELVRLVRAEVLRDTAKRGVLCVATRQAVKAFFEDAGHDFTGEAPSAVSAFMLDTELHGARWLWFGPASLGRNDWQDFGTVLVMGREDIGVDALEDKARAFFGDTGEPLAFIQPDEKGQRFMAPAILPLAMENGETWGIHGRAHPDTRIRALQMQTRELAMRQAIERLRLVNAAERKRVVICSTVPVPGLPVSELVCWGEVAPTRLQAAMAEAAQKGRVLRLSASGLCSDAPNEFPTVNAAKFWLDREGKAAIEDLRYHTGNNTILPVRYLNFVTLRQDTKGARATRAIVFGSDAHAIAERTLGPLSMFEVEPQPFPENLTVVPEFLTVAAPKPCPIAPVPI